jgi:DUF971 family protein
LYSWNYLRELGREQQRNWARYLERCAKEVPPTVA